MTGFLRLVAWIRVESQRNADSKFVNDKVDLGKYHLLKLTTPQYSSPAKTNTMCSNVSYSICIIYYILFCYLYLANPLLKTDSARPLSNGTRTDLASAVLPPRVHAKSFASHPLHSRRGCLFITSQWMEQSPCGTVVAAFAVR